MKIFISYAREDSEFCSRLEHALRERNFEPLVDRNNIEKLTDWWDRIKQLIAQSDTIVFVISPDWVSSSISRDEVTFAGSLNKRFAPVVWRSVQDFEPPKAVTSLNYVFFNDGRSFEDAVDELCGALEADVSWIRDHTRVGEAARRWELKGRPRELLIHGNELKDAEGWLTRRPKKAPMATGLQREFIAASRSGVQKVRRMWAVGAIVIAGVLAQLGALIYFFRTDSQINQARYFLQNHRVEAAQDELGKLWTNPLARIIPQSSSARAIATQLLDEVMVDTLGSFEKAPSDGSAELLATNDALFALFGTSYLQTQFMLLRCDTKAACTTLMLDGNLAQPMLIKDGEHIEVISPDIDKKKIVHARVPSTGPLQLTLTETSFESTPQLKKSGEDWFWVGANYVREFYGETVFSRTPPVLASNNLAKLDLPVFPAIVSVANGASNQSDAGLLREPAVCDVHLTVCVDRIATDARGSVYEYGVWSHQSGLGDQAPSWKRTIKNLFTPLPSINSTAVSRNGKVISISADNEVRIWIFASPSNIRATRIIKLVDNVLAMIFDDNGDLLILTGDKLKRIRLAPRTLVDERPERPTIEPGAITSRESGRTDISEGMELSMPGSIPKIVKYDTGEVVAFDGGRGLWRRIFQPPAPGKTVNSRYWEPQKILTRYQRERGLSNIVSVNPGVDLGFRKEVPGEIVAISGEAKLALTRMKDCNFAFYRSDSAEVALPASSFPVDANCDLFETSHIIRRAGEGRWLVFVRYEATTENHTAYKGMFVEERQTSLKLALIEDDIRRVDVEGQGEDGQAPDSGGDIMYLTGKGEAVAILANGGPQPIRGNADASLAQALNLPEREKVGLKSAGRGRGVILAPAADCGPKPAEGPDERQAYGRMTLIVEDKSSLKTQFEANCVENLSQFISPGAAGVEYFKNIDDVLIGSYSMSGVFFWKPAAGQLRLLRLPVDSPAIGTGKATEVFDFGNGDNATPRFIDASKIDLPAAHGANNFDYSPSSGRLAFYAIWGGSGGNDHKVRLLDLKTLELGETQNVTSEFFDQIVSVEISPNGRLVLTRQDASGYDLFFFEGGRRLGLPKDTAHAAFAGATLVKLTKNDGQRIDWYVPEGDGSEVSHVRDTLLSPQPPRMHLPDTGLLETPALSRSRRPSLLLHLPRSQSN